MSATGLLKQAWREIWQNPGILLLAFWYLVITSAFEYFFISHLGPQVSSWLQQLPSLSAASLPPLGPNLLIKVILVYLTMLFIVSPFALGGLYGGAAASVRERRVHGFFDFFGFAIRNFWRSLALVTLAVASLLILTGIWLLSSALAGSTGGTLVSLVGLFGFVVGLGLLLLWVAFMLASFGALFFGQDRFWDAIRFAARWVLASWGFALRLVMVLMVLLVLAVLVLQSFTAIPLLGSTVGPVLSLFVSGLIMAFLAALAVVLNRESVREKTKPPI